MCNVFSGLVVTEKGKDWGKVLFSSGVHHEKDRETYSQYGDNVLAWESKKSYSLVDGFKFTHNLNVSEKEAKALLKLVEAWAKKQDKIKLLRQMITVIENNQPTENYQITDDMIKLGNNQSILCDFTVHIQAGDDSTQNAGTYSTQEAGNWSTQKAGYKSIQKAGDDSTCVIYGDTSYVVLDGKNVLLTQISSDKRYILELDSLFKKYKVGDKLKIVKGKVIKKNVGDKKNNV